MYESPVSLKSMFFMALLSISILVIGLFTNFEKKTKVVFCDVGQGDAAYIRTRDGVDIVIDAGYSRLLLTCLGRHMPFYDRTIDMLFITHPQEDHFGVFDFVLDRYKVGSVITSAITSEGKSYQDLIKKAEKKGINVISVYTTDVMNIAPEVYVEILWPSYQYLSNNANILENDLFLPQGDPNDFSLVNILSDHNVDILFTGDITPGISNILANDTIKINNEIEVLKVQHHGSKNGLTEDFLKSVNPMLSIISAGKNNKFNHPSPEVTEMFQENGYQYINTADVGDVVIEVYDDGWNVTSTLGE